MRPTGLRSFRFTRRDTQADHGLRISVLPEEAGLWWTALLACRAVDRRWALRHVPGHDKRFPALAVEHREARTAGRDPDPEVAAIRPGRRWRYFLLVARLSALGGFAAVWIVGAVTVAVVILASVGVVEVQVSSR